MKKRESFHLVLAGFLVAAGLILPFVTAHAFGLPGTVLLPMHIPVFLIGLLCGPQYGAIGGIMIPVLSSLLTGMPPVFPMLPIMTGELFTYGLVGGVLYQKIKLPVYPSMLIAMVCGRAVYGIIFSALLTANNGTLQALSVSGAFVQGVPGIVIQLILVPAIVAAVNRYENHGTPPACAAADADIMEQAKKMITGGSASCVVIREGKIVHMANGRGISPLLDLYGTQPELLQGAVVADKIIGKAAAALLVLGGVKEVYGETVSVAAHDYLSRNKVRVKYGRRIDVISNRTGDGLCPLEKAVLNIDNPQTAYEALKETVRQLKSAM